MAKKRINYADEARRIVDAPPESRPISTEVATAAEILDVSPKHVRDLLREKKLPGFQAGRAWRVNVAGLLNLAGIS